MARSVTGGVLPFDDPVGAFCRDNHVALKGADDGPLAGLAFGAKDVFHIAGTPTGFGHPVWLATHEPPLETATAVRRLLDAGADLAGKTHTDEMAYSLTGENVHYGTPVNARAPDRIPGGSSNGSAAAVTAGLVDFAIGTDCGGSVRLPASYCGILGMRPTVDRVPLDGVIPFGPPFDVAGWFARDADVLERVGRVLLADDSQPEPPRRLLRATDAFAMVDEAVTGALERAIDEAAAVVGTVEDVTVAPEGLEAWFETFRVLQAASIRANHGAWIRETRPEFGPGGQGTVRVGRGPRRRCGGGGEAALRGHPGAHRRTAATGRHPVPSHVPQGCAAEEHAGRRHRDPLPPPGHAPALHRGPRRAAPDQSADGRAGGVAAGACRSMERAAPTCSCSGWRES